MTSVTLTRPWLEFDLGQEHRVLSWAINRPGFARTRRILWREVRNADLPRDLDVKVWLHRELHQRGAEDAVCFLTSRDVSLFTRAEAQIGATYAEAIATVGLSNAERVGARVDRSAKDWGTINIAARLSCGLSETGLLEAMSIAAQARTLAVIEAAIPLAIGAATGTGTDCIAIAAPGGQQDYAGLHTEVGEALGSAIYRATLEGARAWRAQYLKSAEVLE